MPKINYGALEDDSSAYDVNDNAGQYTVVFEGDAKDPSGVAVARLNVYEIGEVDALLHENLRQLNAMTYMGVIDSNVSGQTSKRLFMPGSVKIGDTYKIGAQKVFTTKGYYCPEVDDDDLTTTTGKEWAKIGDLLIAQTTKKDTYGRPVEEDDGYIAAANLVWHYVPAGDDTSSRYYFNANKTSDDKISAAPANGFRVSEILATPELENEYSDLLKFNIAQGTDIAVATKTDASGVDRTVTISHATISTTYANAGEGNPPKVDLTENNCDKVKDSVCDYEYVLSAVDSLGVTNGHVTSISRADFKFKDTNASLNTVSTTLAEDVNKGVGLTTKVSLKHHNEATDEKSQTIYYRSDNSNLTVATESMTPGGVV